MCFYDSFYSEINPEYYFYWKMNTSHLYKFVANFLLLLTSIFIIYYLSKNQFSRAF